MRHAPTITLACLFISRVVSQGTAVRLKGNESDQVKEAVDLSKLIDTSFQTKAVSTLGPYTP